MKEIKAVSIVGYKKSGKTTLIQAILKKLRERDFKGKVTVLKHSSSPAKFDDNSDTSLFYENSDEILGIFSETYLYILKERKGINDILKNLNTDLLIVEGFKSLKILPRIIVVKDKGDIDSLKNNLEIGYFTFNDRLKSDGIWGIEDLDKIVDTIIEKGFLLPNINCGKCHERTCFEFAKRLIAGERSIYDCSYIKKDEPLELTINGEEIILNKFTALALKNTISGFISTLKGIPEGEVEIKFELGKK